MTREEAPWSFVGASVQGTSHESSGLPCQDAHAARSLPGGWLAAAVADGAGSAALAEVGAEIAVRASLDYVSAHLPDPDGGAEVWDAFGREALMAARSAVEDEAQKRGVKSRDLASTLIVVVAGPDLVLGAQVGDGCSVIHDASGELSALTLPPPTEYVNETVFLTSASAQSSLQIVVRRLELDHLALLSDGLQPLALRSDETPHEAFFRPLFDFADAQKDGAQEQLTSFLRSPRVRERADDDLTLLIGFRPGPNAR